MSAVRKNVATRFCLHQLSVKERCDLDVVECPAQPSVTDSS